MSDDFIVIEEKPDHHFRTEIPNIVDDLGLSVYAYRVYGKMKRHAGDGGYCNMSIPKIAKAIKCSENTVRDAKKELEAPFEMLGGKPLIRTKKRQSASKKNDTDVVTIVAIWRENGDYYRSLKSESQKNYTGSRDEPPLVHEMNHPGSGDEPKEEPLKEEPFLRKDNVFRETMSSSAKKEKKKDFSITLTPEQKDTHRKIMLYVPPWGEKIESNTVCAWIKKFGSERVMEVLKIYIQDCESAFARGAKIDSMGACMRGAINSGRKPINGDFDANRTFAEHKAKEHTFLETTKKYVKIRATNVREEIEFNRPHCQFLQELESYIRLAIVYA